jgi:hypothetical protein
MKIKWSAFYSLFLLTTLVGCGSEEFGTVPQSTTEAPNPLTSFSHSSCSQSTLVKPKVDVLYLVDNSPSTVHIPSAIKQGIQNTAATLSTAFDYRVIVTPLLETNSGNNDFQVMTNSSELSGIPSDHRRVQVAGQFKFFNTPPEDVNPPKVGEYERGLNRTVSFINAHKNNLLRNGAHLILVIVSNGRDLEIESTNENGQVNVDTAIYNQRRQSLINFKNAQNLNLAQLRLFTVAPKQKDCQEGWRAATGSYLAMAKQLYYESGAGDNSQYEDNYNLCTSEYSNLFAGINSSIQQQVLKHQYRYWPVTFAETNSDVSIGEMKVFKVSQNGTKTELMTPSSWLYEDKGAPTTVDTRELPTVGEPVSGRHFIKFTNGNLISYPDCVLVQSVSKTEYFGYVVLPQKPVPGSVAIWVNGISLPSSAWTDESSTVQTKNIKVDHPSGNPPGSANPPVVKSGFMLKLKPAYYYKSGDNLQINYTPAPI